VFSFKKSYIEAESVIESYTAMLHQNMIMNDEMEDINNDVVNVDEKGNDENENTWDNQLTVSVVAEPNMNVISTNSIEIQTDDAILNQ